MARSILICDDESHILNALEFKLQKGGYDVRTASDGVEAWEHIQQSVPDLVITDCQMPRMNGLELIKRLRENESTRNTAVIMLTAKGYELSQSELRDQLGVKQILPKPFSPREVLVVVERVLGPAVETASG